MLVAIDGIKSFHASFIYESGNVISFAYAYSTEDSIESGEIDLTSGFAEEGFDIWSVIDDTWVINIFISLPETNQGHWYNVYGCDEGGVVDTSYLLDPSCEGCSIEIANVLESNVSDKSGEQKSAP